MIPLISLSTTMHHSRGNRTPPSRQPLATGPPDCLLQTWMWFSCHPAHSQSTDRLYLQAHAIWQPLLWCQMRCYQKLPQYLGMLQVYLPCFPPLPLYMWSHDAVQFQWTSLVGRKIDIYVRDIEPQYLVPEMPVHQFFHCFQHEGQ